MRRDTNRQIREAIADALKEWRLDDECYSPNLLAIYVPMNYCNARELSKIAKACVTIGGEIDPGLRSAVFDVCFADVLAVQAEALRFSADDIEKYIRERNMSIDHDAVVIDMRSTSTKTPRYSPAETAHAKLRFNDTVYDIEDGSVIGRSPESKTGAPAIKFPEELFRNMSRSHASFHYSKNEKRWRYQDENSTNGSRIEQLGTVRPVCNGGSVLLENRAVIWIAEAPPITFISNEIPGNNAADPSSNLNYIERALEFLARSLRPYVADRLKQEFGDSWWEEGVLPNVTEEQQRKLNGSKSRGAKVLDIAMLLRISRRMQAKTKGEFIRGFTSGEIGELIDARNAIAHKTPESERSYDVRKTKRSLTQAEMLCEILDSSKPGRDNAEKIRGLRRAFEFINPTL